MSVLGFLTKEMSEGFLPFHQGRTSPGSELPAHTDSAVAEISALPDPRLVRNRFLLWISLPVYVTLFQQPELTDIALKETLRQKTTHQCSVASQHAENTVWEV